MGKKLNVRLEQIIFFSAWTQRTYIGTYIPSFIQIGQSIWQRINFEFEIFGDFGDFWQILEGTLSLEYHMCPNCQYVANKVINVQCPMNYQCPMKPTEYLGSKDSSVSTIVPSSAANGGPPAGTSEASKNSGLGEGGGLGERGGLSESTDSTNGI